MALNLQVELDSSNNVAAGRIQSSLDLPLEQYKHCKDSAGRFLPRLPKSLDGAISGYGMIIQVDKMWSFNLAAALKYELPLQLCISSSDFAVNKKNEQKQ